VANISLGFNNHELIQLLRERGTALRNMQTLKVEEIDEKLESLKKKQCGIIKEANQSSFVPVTAFITFET